MPLGGSLSVDDARRMALASQEQELFETYRRVFLADYDMRLHAMKDRQCVDLIDLIDVIDC